jgi:hypothetical protein
VNQRLFYVFHTQATMPALAAMAVAHHTIPVNTQRRQLFMVGMDQSDTYNYAVSIARDMTCDMILFWNTDRLPLQQNAVMMLIQAMQQNEQIDMISASPGDEQREHIRRVVQADTCLMLVKASVFERIAAPMGEVDLKPLQRVGGDTGITTVSTAKPAACPIFFTEDPASFAMLCEAGGVHWYEHGAVTCTDATEETESALATSAVSAA